MEYEFRRDLYDRPEASVQMEQALFGRWLGEELGEDRQQAEQILQRARQLRQHAHRPFQWHGHELSLQLDHDSAQVWLQAEGDTGSLEDGFGLADEACEAGLDDFIDLLQGWIEFLG